MTTTQACSAWRTPHDPKNQTVEICSLVEHHRGQSKYCESPGLHTAMDRKSLRRGGNPSACLYLLINGTENRPVNDLGRTVPLALHMERAAPCRVGC